MTNLVYRWPLLRVNNEIEHCYPRLFSLILTSSHLLSLLRTKFYEPNARGRQTAT